MRRLIARTLLFALPFLLYALALAVVDPFDFFGVSRAVPVAVKRATSAKIDPPLWKMIEYRGHPVPNVLLGDSRMLALKPETVRAASGQEYYNFGYGGASLREMISTFWYADSLASLRRVYMGVNFNLYNALVRHDRTQDYRDLEANPLLYFVNWGVLRAAVTNVWYACRRSTANIEAPPMSPERFWRYQLEVTARQSYARFRYPEAERRELEAIAKRCRQKGIRLEFIVFPTHRDLEARVADFGLSAEEARFKRDLAAIAPTRDYDVPGPLTAERGNFSDPYHFREGVMLRLVREIWGGSGAAPAAMRTPRT